MPIIEYDKSVAHQIASAIVAKRNCERMRDAAQIETNRVHYDTQIDRWDETVQHLMREFLPSGSGFDAGTEIVEEKCDSSRLVFETQFHHMNGAGFYDGWTSHRVTVKPSFVGGFDLTVSGRNRNDIKDYIGDTFHNALSSVPARPIEYLAPAKGGDAD